MPEQSILGTWNLVDYTSDLDIQLFEGGNLFSTANIEGVFESSTLEITISENPNTLISTGSFMADQTSVDDNGLTVSVDVDEDFYRSDSWELAGDQLTLMEIEPPQDEAVFIIRTLENNSMILEEQVDISQMEGAFLVLLKGIRTFTFQK